MFSRLLFVFLGSCMFFSTVNLSADEFKVGGHVGYSLGGDIEKSKPAFGAQAEYSFGDADGNSYFFLEFSGTYFSDKDKESEMGIKMEVDIDFIELGLLAGIGTSKNNPLRGYVQGGVAYVIPDADAKVDASGLGRAVGIPGLSATEYMDMDMDNAFGFVLGAGIEYELAENLALFADYRFTIVQLKATLNLFWPPRFKDTEFRADAQRSTCCGIRLSSCNRAGYSYVII